MNTARMWRHGREHLSAWLPVLMMGLFALGTGWLVNNTAKLLSPVTEPPLRHEPDYQMHQFSVRSFDAHGQLTSELMGVDGQHYPDTDTLEVSQPRMRSFDESGQPTVGSAQRGISNRDGSEIQLYGEVRVVREALAQPGGRTAPRLEFRGAYLHVFVNDDRVSSDQPVELIRGVDRFTGDAFEYDHRSGVANLRGHVRGVIQPVRP